MSIKMFPCFIILWQGENLSRDFNGFTRSELPLNSNKWVSESCLNVCLSVYMYGWMDGCAPR
jgi:hypothetical protein